MKKPISYLFLVFYLSPLFLSAQTVTFEFKNGSTDCDTTMCFSVFVSTDEADVFLDELNMRMYTDQYEMDSIWFNNPADDYYLQTGGEIQFGSNNSGQGFFGFTGDWLYAFDNFRRIGIDALTIPISPAQARIFDVCFTISDAYYNEVSNTGNGFYCPVLVFDQDTDGSGFSGGSDGIEILAVNPAGGPSLSLNEATINGNWDYYAPDISLGPCFVDECSLFSLSYSDLNINPLDCERIEINWNYQIDASVNSLFLERKFSDEANWSKIQEWNVTTNFNESASYQYIDNKIDRSEVIVNYRIVVIKDGNILDYSEIINVDLNCDFDDHLSVYPNPINLIAHLEFSSQIASDYLDVILYNSSGGKVKKWNYILKSEATYLKEKLDLSTLPAGNYFLKIYSNTIDKEISLLKL